MPARLMEFQDDFFRYIERVQANTELIQDEVDVREDYGIMRTLRRGVTEHARNMDVPKELVDVINRWRTEMNSSRDGQGAQLIDTYTRLDSIWPTVLKFSEAL